MKLKKDETIVAHCCDCNRETTFNQTVSYNSEMYDMERKIFYCTECLKISRLELYDENKYRTVTWSSAYKKDECKVCFTKFKYGQVLCNHCGNIIWSNYTESNQRYIVTVDGIKYTFILLRDSDVGSTVLVLNGYVIYEEHENSIDYEKLNLKVHLTVKFIKDGQLKIVYGGIIYKSNLDGDMLVYSLRALSICNLKEN